MPTPLLPPAQGYLKAAPWQLQCLSKLHHNCSPLISIASTLSCLPHIHSPVIFGYKKFLWWISDEPKVLDHLKALSLRWKFITPCSPWQGGFYKQLIGVVTASLNRCICHRTLSFYWVIDTVVLCEICIVLSSKPLTPWRQPNVYLVYPTGSQVLNAMLIRTSHDVSRPWLDRRNMMSATSSGLINIRFRFPCIWPPVTRSMGKALC